MEIERKKELFDLPKTQSVATTSRNELHFAHIFMCMMFFIAAMSIIAVRFNICGVTSDNASNFMIKAAMWIMRILIVALLFAGVAEYIHVHKNESGKRYASDFKTGIKYIVLGIILTITQVVITLYIPL